MTILHLALAVVVVLAVAVIVVLASPTRTCKRCKGKRVSRGRLTGRLTGCPRCRGTGRHYRRGAVLLHRLRWSITAELRAAAAERQERRNGDQA